MIIVTGGAGFIGSNFLHYLRKVSDEEVVVLDNLTYAATEEYIPSEHKFIWCDITNEDHVNYIFDKFKPTKVFHFAAESHVDKSISNSNPFISTNINGTINLLNASLKVEVEKFHHISTDEVYGSLNYDDKELFKETTPYDPRNPYSATKAAAEHFVTSWHNTYGLPYLITSSSNNYGPGQHEEKLIPKVVTNALRDEITYMHDGGEQIRDWIHVDDHCCAIWTLDQQKVLNDKFNVGGACELQNIEVTKKILDMMDKPHSLIGVSNDRPGVDKRYGTDFSKLAERTGWMPQIPFDAGLAGTVRFYMNKYL